MPSASKGDGRMPPRRALLFAVAVVCFCVALFAVAGELALRAVAPRSDPVRLGIELPRSTRRYGLRPGVRALQLGVEVATNSLGFREVQYPLAKPAGTRRIVVLGDSYTFGAGVEFRDTFGKRLERRLNEAGRGPHEVINFGVSGYNTVQELATFREVAAAFGPDLVIVAYVLNDTERVGESDTAPAQATDARSFVSSLHLLLKKYSLLYRALAPLIGGLLSPAKAQYAIGKTSLLVRSFDDASVGWIESQRALLDIASEARRIHAALLVVVFPMMIDFSSYALAPAHEKLARFCGDHGIAVLDLLPRFAGLDISNLTVFLDGHPNARAHGIFADGLFAYLSDAEATGP